MQSGPFPPSAPQSAPPPPTQSSVDNGTGKLLAFGCLGLVLMTVLGTLAVVFFLKAKLTGTSLAASPLTPGARAVVTFTDPGKGANGAWLELDVAHTAGLRLMGMFTVTASGRALGQYNLDGDLSGRCTNPVIGQNSASCVDWTFTQVGASGTVAGRTRLFEIPPQPAGTAVSIIGTLYLANGVTARRLALNVRD